MRWGTVTLADEPLELLLAFAAWHRHIGAAEIHLFLDRPQESVARALAEIPGVHVTVCDATFWAAHGGRHHLQTRRQEVVANLAYQQASVAWLAHIDCDEFLAPDGDFDAELAAAPRAIDAFLVPVRERVWARGTAPEMLFEGYFRAPIPGKLALNEVLYGTDAPYLNRGLATHVRGKSVVRRGRDIAMGIHVPRQPDRHHVMQCQSTRLLHFDGLTPFHWLFKRLRYATLPHAETKIGTDNYRWAQIAELRDFATLQDAEAFRGRLMELSADRIAQLGALGLLETATAFDPKAALDAMVPTHEVTLSVTQFDEALRAQHIDFVDGLGLDATGDAERAAAGAQHG